MELRELIGHVEASSLSDTPLDRVSAAMGVKADLDELGDAVIGHFVDAARTAGCSWSEIGAAMGVTKQAAQQRHTSERPRRERPPWRMGYRWTGRAKSVMREAHAAAMHLGAEDVGTEHLLLGILAVPEGLAGQIVTKGGLTRERVLGEEPLHGSGRRRRHMTMDEDAQRAIVAAHQNALRLGHNYVGTEHQLLGLFDVPDSPGGDALRSNGFTKDDVERQVVAVLHGAA